MQKDSLEILSGTVKVRNALTPKAPIYSALLMTRIISRQFVSIAIIIQYHY